MSYTSFSYSDLELSEDADSIIAAVTVTNTGSRHGTETVQLYMQDVTASLVRPVKELKQYAKVTLPAGKSAFVELRLYKSEMGFWNNAGEYVLEPGLFRIFVGGNSRDCLMKEIRL